MKINQVDLAVEKQELELIEKSIAERWLTEGQHTQSLAEHVSNFTGCKFVTFAPNGTLGLFLSLLAADIEPGSEILIPSFTFYASATSAIYAGLIPRFVDVFDDTFNMNVDLLEQAITSKTKAIMPVHCYGQSCDMDKITLIAKKYNLFVLEDAAQAYGTMFDGRMAGTIGDVGVYSFYSDKIITMGEGAVIVTHSEQLFQKIKLIRNQGREHSGTFFHEALGMNFRITDIQAAIGLAQARKFPSILSKRLEKWRLYEELLCGIGDISFMTVHEKSTLVPFRFPIRTRHKKALCETLENAGIQTRGFFYPLDRQPKLASYAEKTSSPISKMLSDSGVCLPIHHNISFEDINYISKTIRFFFDGQ